MSSNTSDSDEGDILEVKTNATNAITFKLVYHEDDLINQNEKCEFKPVMAHQVFSDKEVIYGYKNLSVNLYYLHNSSNCFVDVNYSKQVEQPGVEHIVETLNPWLPAHFTQKTSEFKKMIQNEKRDQMFGKVLHQFQKKTDVPSLPGASVLCTYKITECDTQDALFQQYHQRFETFIIWFIDAANFIDLSDERWAIFYMYEEYKHPSTGESIVTPIGFTALYKFFLYPDKSRARISQFFVLPTHQRKGLGKELYNVVCETIRHNMEDVFDFTVEEPNMSFQELRDVCDYNYIKENMIKTGLNFNTVSPQRLNKYMQQLKIGKKQAGRLRDIINFVRALKSGDKEVAEFKAQLFSRMQEQIKAEYANMKRTPVCDINPDALIKQILNAKYMAYLESFSPVAQKIRNLE